MMRDRKIVNQLLNEVDKCELCGSRRNLEVHHIIPLVCQSYGVNLECQDNMIVICGSCHSKLTPKSLLTKIGIAKSCKAYDPLKRLYQKIENDDYAVSAADVLDYAKEMAEEYITNRRAGEC